MQDLLLPTHFAHIEQQLERLIDVIDSLEAENDELRKREQQLVQQCELLTLRNAKACEQIEAIISQLKQQT